MAREADKFMFSLNPDDKVLSTFPYFHVGGLISVGYWCLVQGATNLVFPKYHPEAFLQAIQAFKVPIALCRLFQACQVTIIMLQTFW